MAVILTDLYKRLFGGSVLGEGNTIDLAEHGRVGGVSTGQGFKHVASAYETGTWGYSAGTSGTETLTGSKRVLQITAVCLGNAGTVVINGGDTITIPYDSSDKASSSLTIHPRGVLTDPEIVFTDTDAYFIEWVT